MVFIFQTAKRVRDPLDSVGYRVGEVVHRIDAPFIASAVMFDLANPVHRRIAHVDVGRGHVDFRPQHVNAVVELAFPHAFKQRQVFFDWPVAIRAIATRRCERSSVSSHVFGVQLLYVRLPFPD